MGAKASAVLNFQGDQDVWASMNRCDRFNLGLVCKELAVFCLLRNIAMHKRYPLDAGTEIYRCNECVDHEVSVFRKKV